MENFKKNLNITKLKPGSWRSMLGYAGHEIALGRLLSCGFNVARSLWRDGKYDGALDVNNVLIKIEIKSSTTTNYSVTSGQRGGLSIRKEVKSGSESREEILKKDDADFFVGVSLIDGSCCIVPIELVAICKRKTLPIKSLEKYINLLSENKTPIEDKELLSRHDNFNEIILNGLRLKRGIKLSDLNNYNDLISKDSLNKINNKWDCLSISNKNIKLIDNGFLFVDEITKDLFI